MTDSTVDEIESAVARSELAFFNMHRVHDGTPTVKSCSFEVRQRLAAKQAKYFPASKDYKEFLESDDLRFLRNTEDVRKVDSMYRTQGCQNAELEDGAAC